MARSSQVVLIKEVAFITAVLRDIDLRWHFVVDVRARRMTTAQNANLAYWIAGEDVGLSSLTPLR